MDIRYVLIGYFSLHMYVVLSGESTVVTSVPFDATTNPLGTVMFVSDVALSDGWS